MEPSGGDAKSGEAGVMARTGVDRPAVTGDGVGPASSQMILVGVGGEDADDPIQGEIAAVFIQTGSSGSGSEAEIDEQVSGGITVTGGIGEVQDREIAGGSAAEDPKGGGRGHHSWFDDSLSSSSSPSTRPFMVQIGRFDASMKRR